MSPIRTGVGEYAYELLNAVFELDKENKYFLFYNSYSDVSKNIPKWDQENVHYTVTRWPNKVFNGFIRIAGVPKLDKIIKNNIDVFFSPNLNFTSLSKKTKFVITIHDLPFEIFPEFSSLRQRLWHKIINPKKQCQLADIILTPSENTKRDVADIYKINPDKIKVLYHGVKGHPELVSGSPEMLKQVQHDTKQKYNLPDKFILFLGTVESRKNVTGLIEAFEKSFSSLPVPYSLIIAGATGHDFKKIKQCAGASPLKDRIKFIGYVEPAEKPALYSMADLFVYPSFYEGFGFPVIEAMACGTPVITSNRSSLPEVANDAAYLINSNDTASIVRGIVKILTDQRVKENFKTQGIKQAQKFSWNQTARQWLEIIK